MEYSINEVARAAGVSSRTLRHYDDIGLLPAARSANGYRSYSQQDMVRLQRILLLRNLGLNLPAIAELIAGEVDDVVALRAHLGQLRRQAERLDRQISSVERTIHSLDTKETLMAEQVFDGFDNSQYREEVEQRWGEQAWSDSDRWWKGLTDDDKRAFHQEHCDIAAAWAEARAAGLLVDSEPVLAIAERHANWIAIGWQGKKPSPDALVGLAEMYVADERFAANYGGVVGAQYVRDGLVAYAVTMLE